ncbi:MAG: glycine cleavage system protein H [Candidatus Helarchaeota archaeon]
MVKVGDYELPDDLYYHKKHVWAKLEGDNVKVGIDQIGLAIAGKIVFVKLKKLGREIPAGKSLGTAEAGKGVIPITAPITGEIIELNPDVDKRNTAFLNEDPYGKGWVAILKPTGDLKAELDQLISGDKIKEWGESELKEIE